MRVVVAPDKFKGSLTAAQAADAIASGWKEGWGCDPSLEVQIVPIADGGEGTGEILRNTLGGRIVRSPVHDPLGRPVDAPYTRVRRDGMTVAILETSEAIGLKHLGPGERDLMRASTFGAGELLCHALRITKANRVIAGLGGSATNDGGLGFAAAMGYRFFDSRDQVVEPIPMNLGMIRRVEAPGDPLLAAKIEIACDVSNPLLGRHGSTRVIGPQKGLRGE